jgi:hypothetical protein
LMSGLTPQFDAELTSATQIEPPVRQVASGAIQTLESAGNADISMQSASGGGTKRQILTTSGPSLRLS